MKNNKHLIFILFLAIFCAVLYGYRMASIGLSDPDETFYAETAREMLQFKSFMTPYIFDKPQFEKPPMFYWLIILASLSKGINEFAVRFVPALFGIIGVISIYFLGNSMFNRKTAMYAAFILATNFLYLGLSRCALTDIVFTAFVLLSLLFFYLGYRDEKRRRINLYFFFLSCALATLTKGPLGILIPVFTILPFLIFARDIKFLKQIPWFWGILIFVLVAVPLYAIMAVKHKEFLKDFFYYENTRRFFIAEHRSSNRWYFYPSVILGSTFPWNILLPLIFVSKEATHKKAMLFLKCWFWVPLIFFTAAQSKLSSYILPLYPAICLGLARAITRIEESASSEIRLKIGKAISTLLALIFLSGFIVSLFFLRSNFPAFFQTHLLAVIIVCLGIISAMVFLWKGKYKLTVIFEATTVLLFIVILMSRIWIAEGAFSDKDLPGIIKQNSDNLSEEIVCSKIYARGVYFYTHKKVVVINNEKKAFFRPHPIEVISSETEIKDYFKTGKAVLCVVDKQCLERINSLIPARKNKVLYENFDRIVVISNPIQ